MQNELIERHQATEGDCSTAHPRPQHAGLHGRWDFPCHLHSRLSNFLAGQEFASRTPLTAPSVRRLDWSLGRRAGKGRLSLLTGQFQGHV